MADDSYEEIPEHQDADGQPMAKKRRGAAKSWVKEKEFESTALVLEFVKNENCWSITNGHDTIDGRKVYYRCNRTKKSKPQCSSAICLLYHADKESVTLYRTLDGHDHDGYSPARGLDSKTREAVGRLCDDGVNKPRSILLALRSKGLPEPSLIALKNFLAAFKKKRGPVSISIGELKEWCGQRCAPFPGEPNKAFVVRRSSGKDGCGMAFFRVFISSPRLLQFALKGVFVHADATRKLVWQGFPVLVVGTSDRDGQFFPIGIGVCSGETSEDFAFIFQSVVEGVRQACNEVYRPSILIADASDAVTGGFASVFGDNFKRITCSAQMIRATDKKLEKTKDGDKRQQLRADIVQLQLCPSEEIFAPVLELFFDKWSQDTTSEIHDFLEYFKREWVDSHSNWYEGYADHAPSTNNGIEALNNSVKSEQTLRQRLPLPRFMNLIEQLLVRWSIERDPITFSCKKFAESPTRTTSVWTSAYQWASSPTSILSKNVGDGFTEYYIAAGDVVITPAVVTAYRSAFLRAEWKSFDEYVAARNSIWVVLMNGDHYEDAACNCPVFLKKSICEHTLGIAIRKRYCEPPAIAKSVAQVEKRKRGRPRKTSARLSCDEVAFLEAVCESL